MRQVDKMRELYRKFNGDPERCIAEYAAAELCGEVRRKSNTWGMDAETYAARLFQDGVRKGWMDR
ncbi:MAG: hypothetical protein ABL949_06055 [Fimbriimonadaceae bacterium]